MVEALHVTWTNRAVVEAAIKKDFPNIADPVAKMALERCYKDQLFSRDGVMSSPAYDKDMASVYSSGEMTRHVAYSEVADMSFVLKAHKGK
jgi:NitT/TauT family transport system substrate-binding protein